MQNSEMKCLVVMLHQIAKHTTNTKSIDYWGIDSADLRTLKDEARKAIIYSYAFQSEASTWL